jgi:hypothetical protein
METGANRVKRNIAILFFFLSILAFGLLGFTRQEETAPQQPTGTPRPVNGGQQTPVRQTQMPGKQEPDMQMFAFFTPPPTVYPPTQADQGAQTYFYVCMVCHGDRGQGLTAWRAMLPTAEMNCWQSKCHAPSHVEFGFTFPKEVPPVVSPYLLTTFGNAQNLYNFLKTQMPWQAPGSLTDEQYLQLTAYLMRANGSDPGKVLLKPDELEKITFGGQAATPAASNSFAGISSSILVLMVIVFILLIGLLILLYYRNHSQKQA